MGGKNKEFFKDGAGRLYDPEKYDGPFEAEGLKFVVNKETDGSLVISVDEEPIAPQNPQQSKEVVAQGDPDFQFKIKGRELEIKGRSEQAFHRVVELMTDRMLVEPAYPQHYYDTRPPVHYLEYTDPQYPESSQPPVAAITDSVPTNTFEEPAPYYPPNVPNELSLQEQTWAQQAAEREKEERQALKKLKRTKVIGTVVLLSVIGYGVSEVPKGSSQGKEAGLSCVEENKPGVECAIEEAVADLNPFRDRAATKAETEEKTDTEDKADQPEKE